MNALADTLNCRRTLGVLVLANAALIGALALFSSPQQAHAVGGGGDYVMAVGQSMGSLQETVYIVDARSGKAFALSFNGSNKSFDKPAVRDIAEDLNEKAGSSSKSGRTR